MVFDEYAMQSFLILVKSAIPYSLCWYFGTKAFYFIYGALTGKGVKL